MDGETSGGRKAPSLKGQFAAAIALTIGFYLLALALAAALIGFPVYLLLAQGRVNFLTISGVFIGGSILWAVFPRRLRFDPPGARIADGDQPRLLQLIREESEAAGEDPRAARARAAAPRGRTRAATSPASQASVDAGASGLNSRSAQAVQNGSNSMPVDQ